MNASDQKKWFIYFGDHHEGPFALHQVESMLQQGRATSAMYVWCQGMSDWQVMTEVEEFTSVVAKVQQSSQSSAETSAPTVEEPAVSVEKVVAESPTVMTAITPSASPEKEKSSAWLWIVAGLMVVSLGGALSSFVIYRPQEFQDQLYRVSKWIPYVAKWASAVPPLEDVSQDELEELRAAVRLNPESNETTFALALSKGDSSVPSFYLSGNIEKGAELQLQLRGSADALLGQLQAHVELPVVFQAPFMKVGPVQAPEGHGLIKGEYLVSVRRKDGKDLARKVYFLGGARDAAYEKRLKEYHEQIRAKSTAELAELKQFAATLESLLKQTQEVFAAVSQQKNPKLKQKAWAEFHEKWIPMERQFQETLSKWTPEVLNTQMYHFSLYLRFTEIVKNLMHLHSAQSEALTQNPAAGLADSFNQEGSNVAQQISQFMSKLEEIEKSPLSPKGIPYREVQ